MSAIQRRGNRPTSVQFELDELQRKYRQMELNRKTNNDESQNTLRMQKQQIEKLRKDNERLKEELALETRQAKIANNAHASFTIAKLQDQGEVYAAKISKLRISFWTFWLFSLEALMPPIDLRC